MSFLYIIPCLYLLSVSIICYQESKVGWPITPYRKLIPFTLYHMILATFQLLYIIPIWFIISKEYRSKFVWDQVAWNFKLLFPIWWGKIKWKGIENIPDEQCIWVGNHQSILDMAIMSMLPCKTPMIGTSKHSIKYIPASGILALLCGTILIKRGSSNSRELFHNDCVKAIRKGNSLNIFPQGKRKHNKAGTLPFKRGAFDLAINESIFILPYKIKYGKNITVQIYPKEYEDDIDELMNRVYKILL